MPLDLVTELEGLVDAFEAAGVGYAVCGGLALAVHGFPRATMDIDFLVRSEEIADAVAVAKLAGFEDRRASTGPRRSRQARGY